MPPHISRDIIKKNDSTFAYYFSAQIAYVIVRLIYRTPITPNMCTIASLVLGLLAAVVASFGGYANGIFAILLLNISFILDCCDGQLARARNTSSAFGAWLDAYADRVKDIALLLGFALGYMNEGPHREWILIALFCAASAQFLRTHATHSRELFRLEHEGKKEALRSPIALSSQTSQFVKTLRYSILFKIAERVALFTFFAALHKIEIGIILYGCIEMTYALASTYLNYTLTSSYDNKRT